MQAMSALRGWRSVIATRTSLIEMGAYTQRRLDKLRTAQVMNLLPFSPSISTSRFCLG